MRRVVGRVPPITPVMPRADQLRRPSRHISRPVAGAIWVPNPAVRTLRHAACWIGVIFARSSSQLRATRPQKLRWTSPSRLTLGTAGHLQTMRRAMARCPKPRPPPTPSLLQRCHTRHQLPYTRFLSQLRSAARSRHPPAPRSALRPSHHQSPSLTLAPMVQRTQRPPRAPLPKPDRLQRPPSSLRPAGRSQLRLKPLCTPWFRIHAPVPLLQSPS